LRLKCLQRFLCRPDALKHLRLARGRRRGHRLRLGVIFRRAVPRLHSSRMHSSFVRSYSYEQLLLIIHPSKIR
jgi:hypothetical protein